jgi:lipopolysaccharide/colanic/teichoic acid biosynthesis glycosyltransferase
LSGVPIQEVTSAYESLCGRLPIAGLDPSRLVLSREIAPRRGHYIRHRALELALAICAAPLALPLMLVIAALLKLSTRGPVWERKQCVGRDSVPFWLYQFRLGEYEPASSASRMARSLRIQAMPQLINVLKGEMSVFGPRPVRVELAEAYSTRIPFYHHRHSIRPGITGWMQIHDRSADQPEDVLQSLEYDLYYVKHASFTLDLLILLHTIKVMVSGRNAG